MTSMKKLDTKTLKTVNGGTFRHGHGHGHGHGHSHGRGKSGRC